MSGGTDILSSFLLDGWQSPNAHDKHFAAFPASPGVYIFLYIENVISVDSDRRIVYVGMSKNLRQRHNNHETLAVISAELPLYGHVQCWFKTMEASEIAAAEIELIEKYDPSFNIVHRRRSL